MKKTLSSLAALSLLAAPAFALADTADSGLIKGGALNLRAKAKADAKVLGQYATGTLVEIISSVNDTWAKVKVNGKDGYMMKKYLNEAKGDSSLLVYTTTGKGLNMREAPSNAGAIITSYPKATKIKILQKGINWSRVLMDGKEGFMATQYLVASMPPAGSIVSGDKAVVNNPKATQVLNLREAAKTDSKSIGQYKNGKEVTILEKGAIWSKVKVDDKEGYMMNQYLKFPGSYVQPAFKELETPYTAKLININGTGIVNFRDGGSLSAKVIHTYKVGTEAKVTALSTDWARVEIEGEVGYVSLHFMKKQTQYISNCALHNQKGAFLLKTS